MMLLMMSVVGVVGVVVIVVVVRAGVDLLNNNTLVLEACHQFNVPLLMSLIIRNPSYIDNQTLWQQCTNNMKTDLRHVHNSYFHDILDRNVIHKPHTSTESSSSSSYSSSGEINAIDAVGDGGDGVGGGDSIHSLKDTSSLCNSMFSSQQV